MRQFPLILDYKDEFVVRGGGVKPCQVPNYFGPTLDNQLGSTLSPTVKIFEMWCEIVILVFWSFKHVFGGTNLSLEL